MRIEREHSRQEAIMPTVYEDMGPSFRSIESFIYRISKGFEDKRPIGDRGKAMDQKMHVREVERRRTLEI